MAANTDMVSPFCISYMFSSSKQNELITAIIPCSVVQIAVNERFNRCSSEIMFELLCSDLPGRCACAPDGVVVEIKPVRTIQIEKRFDQYRYCYIMEYTIGTEV